MAKIRLEILTPQGLFFSSIVEMVVINEEKYGRAIAEKGGASFRRLGRCEVKFMDKDAKIRTVFIPGGHIHAGKTLSIYTKYANWKRE